MNPLWRRTVGQWMRLNEPEGNPTGCGGDLENLPNNYRHPIKIAPVCTTQRVGRLPLERRKEPVRFSRSVCIFFSLLSRSLSRLFPRSFSRNQRFSPGLRCLFDFSLFFFPPPLPPLLFPTRVCLCKNLPMKSTLSVSLSLSLSLFRSTLCTTVSETVKRRRRSGVQGKHL